MAGPAVNDAQLQPCLIKICVKLVYDRLFGILKINGQDIADRRGGLIHQSARLSKIDIFRILPDLGNQHRVRFSVMEKGIDDIPDQYLKSRRGTESGAGKDRREGPKN